MLLEHIQNAEIRKGLQVKIETYLYKFLIIKSLSFSSEVLLISVLL